jgi:hypothetical protein
MQGFFLAGQSHYKDAKHQELLVLLYLLLYKYILTYDRRRQGSETAYSNNNDCEQVPFYQFYLVIYTKIR